MNEHRKAWFGTVVALFIVFILALSFNRFYINKDFISYDFLSCDPSVQPCFVRVCEQEDPRCNKEMTEDGLYFFFIQEKKNDFTQAYYCSEDSLE